ncbi:MAG: glycosyl transferase [Planctomycetes bacterium]|nr:glycosyl transferase [Planctomycetota bacterium]
MPSPDEHYVTLFDQAFLPYGMALHASLMRHGEPFRLWVVCLDEVVEQRLRQLALPGVETIALAAIEDADLLRVKPTRSRAEYCWTLTPCTFAAVFAHAPEAQRVTYIDSDVWLVSSPGPIFAELDAAGADVLITDHGFAPRYAHLGARSGRFCVQFLVARRGGSDAIIGWWRERCLEWCYDRYDAGRFGDQKYLDRWQELFGARVRVLEHPELTQAPWNVERFRPEQAAIFHFQGFRRVAERTVMLYYGYRVPDHAERFYRGYLADFRAALERLETLGVRVPVSRYRPLKRLKASLMRLVGTTRFVPLDWAGSGPA